MADPTMPGLPVAERRYLALDALIATRRLIEPAAPTPLDGTRPGVVTLAGSRLA